GDDDDRVTPEGAGPDPGYNVIHVQLPAKQAGISGMLVVRPERLHEADGRQGAVAEGSEEIRLVLQVSGLGLGSIGVIAEEDEGLVVELKQRVRLSGHRIIPPAGIP